MFRVRSYLRSCALLSKFKPIFETLSLCKEITLLHICLLDFLTQIGNLVGHDPDFVVEYVDAIPMFHLGQHALHDAPNLPLLCPALILPHARYLPLQLGNPPLHGPHTVLLLLYLLRHPLNNPLQPLNLALLLLIRVGEAGHLLPEPIDLVLCLPGHLYKLLTAILLAMVALRLQPQQIHVHVGLGF